MQTLKPQLSMLAPRLGYAQGREQDRNRQRDATQHWRSWYKTSRWQKLRWRVLVRDCFKCAACKRTIAEKGEAVCDHVVSHRGSEAAFWAGPFQTLCKGCHDAAKQREEIAARSR